MRLNMKFTPFEVAQIADMLQKSEHCNIRYTAVEDSDGDVHEWVAEDNHGVTYLQCSTGKWNLSVNKLLLTNKESGLVSKLQGLLAYIAQSNGCQLTDKSGVLVTEAVGA